MEVAAVLRHLCVSLESFYFKEESRDCSATRQSIVDPGVMMMGHRTTITSARVDGLAHAQRTHMSTISRTMC